MTKFSLNAETVLKKRYLKNGETPDEMLKRVAKNIASIEKDKKYENIFYTLMADLVYIDPPYLITKAAYNDGKRGMNGWSNEQEKLLYQILSNLNNHNYYFILSNVKEHKGKTNIQLIDWANQNNYKIVEMGLSGWRYAKSEIIVTNIK